jgi:hypothetical protein
MKSPRGKSFPDDLRHRDVVEPEAIGRLCPDSQRDH